MFNRKEDEQYTDPIWARRMDISLTERTKRVIFVGDVHGKFAKLKGLLHYVTFDRTKDLLICCGDLVNKGEEDDKVVKFVKANGLSVRGNHDQHLSDTHFERRQVRPKDLKSFARLERKLKDPEWNWLDSLPLWIDLEVHKTKLRVVHAAWPFHLGRAENWIHVLEREDQKLRRKQDPVNFMSLPIHKELMCKRWWSSDYEKFIQTEEAKAEKAGENGMVHRTIIYGHDALTSDFKNLASRDKKHSFCLDSGATYGGFLTAFVWSTESDSRTMFYFRREDDKFKRDLTPTAVTPHIRTNEMEGKFVYNNGNNLIIVRPNDVSLDGKLHPRHGVGKGSFYIDVGLGRWYFIWRGTDYRIIKDVQSAQIIKDAKKE